MKLKFFSLALAAAAALTCASCSDDDPAPAPIPPTEPHVLTDLYIRSNEAKTEVQIPEAAPFQCVAETTADWLKLNITNGNTVLELTAEPNLTGEERKADIVVKETQGGVTLYEFSVAQSAIDILSGEIVLKEIFFTSNALPSTGRPDKFHGDQYFIIANNSKRSIDVTGLMIMEGKITSAMDWSFPDDIRPQYTPVQTVYCIPKNGDKNILNPGDQMIIANNATDHTQANPNSFDLSGANYEWYDVSSNDRFQDTDYPADNLDIWYTYSLTTWSLHDRGFQGYAIALPPANMTKETFLADYKWEGEYIMNTPAGQFPMQIKDAYKVPNAWVLDAVNLAVPSAMKILSFDQSQDAGYTYCGNIDMDPERFGKSVRRKTSADGQSLVDTNNSTNDFEPNAKPSLAM